MLLFPKGCRSWVVCSSETEISLSSPVQHNPWVGKAQLGQSTGTWDVSAKLMRGVQSCGDLVDVFIQLTLRVH